MIRKLRKKFVFAAMCAIFIVLETIIGVVNIVNYEQLKNRADQMSSLIEAGGGRLEMHERGQRQEGFEKPDAYSEETPYETRFFTVSLDLEGNITACDMRNIAAIGQTEAKAYAQEVFQQSRDTGFQGIYRYRKTVSTEGVTMIFLDCRRELSAARSFALLSIGMSGVGLAAVFVLVVIFSRIVFRPVAESYEKQKQFITDAGHEIKTPLTIIDANTEVVEMEYGESQWTKSTRNQVQRLTQLTQQLITLAKMDEEKVRQERKWFSLSDVVTEGVQLFEAPAKMQHHTWNVMVQDNLRLRGDEKSVRQMMEILLDNAVKYALPESEITVALQKRGSKLVLQVSNPTEPFPLKSLERIFERFYRMDESRNSEKGGTGIGLAVAKAVADSHKAKITAESLDGRHLTITVVF